MKSIYGLKSKVGEGSLIPPIPSNALRSRIWKPFFRRYWLPIFFVTFSGCSLLGSVSEVESQISQLDNMITELEGELELAKSPEDRKSITIQIDALTARKNALVKKAQKAKEVTEAAGSGVSALLGILGVVLGIPALGAGAPLVKRLITGA